MLQFDMQCYEELTVAWVRTVKFISGAFFWPTGQLVVSVVTMVVRLDASYNGIQCVSVSGTLTRSPQL